jgi:hypothetical protein
MDATKSHVVLMGASFSERDVRRQSKKVTGRASVV